jgi:hypothetical protein
MRKRKRKRKKNQKTHAILCYTCFFAKRESFFMWGRGVGVLRFELRTYTLSHSSTIFCDGFFETGTISPGVL